MDNFVNEKDFELLDQDKYSFSVLSRILHFDCSLVLSDHENFIICYSCPPYPVWVWSRDDCGVDAYKAVFRACLEHDLFRPGMSFNLKYDCADFFFEKGREDGIEFKLNRKLFAYECSDAIKPSVKCDGQVVCCGDYDLDELAEMCEAMHNEMDLDRKSREEHRADLEEDVSKGFVYFWKNKNGEHVACCDCKINPDGKNTTMGLVYTRPEFRRMHYAENLVYQVSKASLDGGYKPILYTDADYAASNSCYEKIGYQLKGKLCTIGLK